MDIPSYILGKKAGGSGPTPTYQSKDVSITQNGTTTITPDTGYDALSDVDVTVTGILDTSDANAVASDMAIGKTAYVNGSKITGNVPVGSSSVATNYASNNIGTYLDDLKVDTEQGNQNQMFRTGDKISVYAPLSDVAPVVGASAEKIKKDEVICGVTGTYEGGAGKYAPKWIKFQGYTGTDLSYEIQNLDISNMTSMIQLFNNCSNITTLDLSSFNTSNISTMASMFNGCQSLTSLNLSNFNTSNVTNADGFLNNCKLLTSITFGNSCTFENNSSFASMFNGCQSLTTLDLSMFNTKKTTSILNMFSNCFNLEHINFGSNFELPSLNGNYSNMFASCSKLDDSTLNDILHICTTIGSGNRKTLAYLGITNSTLVAKVPTLSNYQEFLDAGWTIS